MRASCSLSVSSEQDAFPYGNTALTHYQIVFLQYWDAPRMRRSTATSLHRFRVEYKT
ncbi:MAG: hypothetical protein AAF630_18370 [Cyanobacteria bacterium P01_C01_bin.38]